MCDRGTDTLPRALGFRSPNGTQTVAMHQCLVWWSREQRATIKPCWRGLSWWALGDLTLYTYILVFYVVLCCHRLFTHTKLMREVSSTNGHIHSTSRLSAGCLSDAHHHGWFFKTQTNPKAPAICNRLVGQSTDRPSRARLMYLCLPIMILPTPLLNARYIWNKLAATIQ